MCYAFPAATGCEEISDRRHGGCYVHTKAVVRGNNVGHHSCWVFSKCAVHRCDEGNGGCNQICNKRKVKYYCSCKVGFVLGNDQKTCKVHPCDEATNGGCSQICNKRKENYYCTCTIGFALGSDRKTCKKAKLVLHLTDPRSCPMEKGNCVSQHGVHQKSTIIQLNVVNGSRAEVREACFEMCYAYPGAIGCEVLWHRGNRGCYVHHNTVARGNNKVGHSCWIFSKCKVKPAPLTPNNKCPMEKGYCVLTDGRNQTSGVTKLKIMTGNTTAHSACFKMCYAFPAATGCEEISDRKHGGCYVHTKAVARGNNVGNHSCWVFSKCAVHRCDDGNGGCNQICNKRKVKYDCSCKVGFVLGNDQKICEVHPSLVHPCDKATKGGCSQFCNKRKEKYYCSCTIGFVLGSDRKTCKKVHPCDKPNHGGCSQICNKRNEMYNCSCKAGYVLRNDQKTCKRGGMPRLRVTLQVIQGYPGYLQPYSSSIGLTNSFNGLPASLLRYPGAGLRRRVYVELKLNPTMQTSKLLPISCMATPTPNKLSPFRYEIIKDGKPVDATFIRHRVENTAYMFSVSPLNIAGVPQVFMHCKSRITCKTKDADIENEDVSEENDENSEDVSYYTVDSTARLQCASNELGRGC